MTEEKTSPSFIEKKRGPAELFKDTFHFLGEETLLLFQAIGLYSFSLLFLSLLLSYIVLDTYPGLERLYYIRENLSRPGIVFMVLCIIIYTASFCTLSLVVSQLLLNRKDHENSPEVFSRLKSRFPSQLSSYVFNFLIIYMLYSAIRFFLRKLDTLPVFKDYGDFDLGVLNGGLNWLLGNIPSLVVMPLVLYFCFASLFVSVRDNIGSSDALKKIYEISKDKLSAVWLQSIALLLTAAMGEWALNYRWDFLTRYLPFNYDLLFVVFTTKKLLAFCLLVYLQVGTVLLFGSVEAQKKEPEALEVNNEETT